MASLLRSRRALGPVTMAANQAWTAFATRDLDSYHFGRKIAEGGMGSIRTGMRNGDSTLLALKSAADDTSVATIRLARELRALHLLRGPHVVRLLDWGLWQEQPAIVMEWVSGVPLGALIPALQQLRQAGASELQNKLVMFLMREISTAVASVHQKGFLHRDLKPGNVIVRPDGTVVVIDFGVADQITRVSSLPGIPPWLPTGELAERLTTDGATVGTVLYMSPEQAEAGPLSYSSDVYSLAVLATELSTGEVPFFDEQVTALQVLCRKCNARELPDPRTWNPAMAPELVAAIAAAGQTDPSLRPQSAAWMQRYFAASGEGAVRAELQQLVQQVAPSCGTLTADLVRTRADVETM